MLRKLLITIFWVLILAFNANAGSDGELSLKNKEQKQTKDCFEKLNRATFAFNQSFDKAVVVPLAKGYRNLPDPVQRGTSNAVKNLSTVAVATIIQWLHQRNVSRFEGSVPCPVGSAANRIVQPSRTGSVGIGVRRRLG